MLVSRFVKGSRLRCASVVEWLRSLLRGLSARSWKGSRDLDREAGEYGLAATLLRTRWGQIGDACITRVNAPRPRSDDAAA